MPKARGSPAAGGAKNAKPAARKLPPKKTTGAGAGAGGTGAGTAGAGAARPAAAKTVAADRLQRSLPYALQQRVLDVFGRALAPTLASPQLGAALQAVKQALFARDFAAAFGEGTDGAGSRAPPVGEEEAPGTAERRPLPALLDAYAARWSPTRALCYAAVLGSPMVQERWRSAEGPLRMVAIGGGAAEVVAFGAVLADGEPGQGRRGDAVLVDSGPWASVVERLRTAMVADVPDGPHHQPALVQPAARLRVDVRRLDILQVQDDTMAELLGGIGTGTATATATATATSPAPTTLVTLFFTLNELFTAGGVGAAAACLLRLTAAAAPGTLLLVVDSPGSYSETAVGAQARRYPMRWLLDKFLLLQDDADAAAWTKLHEDDAVWCRLPASLAYPIRLEDMRYQVHFYVRA